MKISDFYGTDVYMDIDDNSSANVIAKHTFDNIEEKCVFDINTSQIIEGGFSNDERYEDMKEWLNDNRNELLEMWNNKKPHSIGGLV